MVLHIYHATIGEKEFQFSTEINNTTKESFAADVNKVVEEVSSTMLEQLTGEDAMCSTCKTAPAVRLIHQTMLFDKVFPPRVEDMPYPVCNNPNCDVVARAKFAMVSEQAMEDNGGPSPNGCFRCHRGANGVRMAAPLLRCSRCKVAKYCTAECQKADWKVHKQVCAPYVPLK